MKFFKVALVALASLASSVSALTPAQWRSQSIYQVLTDRFARTDGSTTATCNTGDQIYCGGSWQGIIDQLDYVPFFPFRAYHYADYSPLLDPKYGIHSSKSKDLSSNG